MKRMLMVATVASMIGQFNMSNIRILQNLGYKVDVACDFHDRTVWTEARVEQFQKQLQEMGIKYYQIDFVRDALKLGQHCKSYRQIIQLLNKQRYEFIHCHTPIASVICRIASHKKKIKCIYTAHGFHFYQGAPLKNWMIFYPIEKFFSRWTDVLITINREDYQRAKKKFHASNVVYIPGVGLDTEKFRVCDVNRKEKLAEFGVPEDGFVLLSVGELNRNKNQAIIIDAIRELHNLNIYYLIVGLGGLYVDYQEMIKEYGLEKQVKLLGYRTDVRELCHVTNCFIHISLREGLGIAPLEAMASGLPLIASNIHGIKDYAKTRVTGYCVNPYSIDEIKEAIEKMVNDVSFCEQCSQNNLDIVKKFDISNTEKIMKEIYHGIG